MFYFSINNSALKKIEEEAKSTDKEIIGILIGKVYDNLLVVNDAVSGDQASGSTRVKLDNETLAGIVDRIMKGELDGNILGWYHSHPGFGVFMSATDIATQQMLQQFSNKVAALVIDPKEGVFEIFTLDVENGVTPIPKTQVYRFDDGEDGIPPELKDAHRMDVRIEVLPEKGPIDRIRYVIDGTASFWLEKKCIICGRELLYDSTRNCWSCPTMASSGLMESGTGIVKIPEDKDATEGKKDKKAGHRCKKCDVDLKYSKKLGAWYCRKCRRVYKHVVRKKGSAEPGDKKEGVRRTRIDSKKDVIVEAVATLEITDEKAPQEAEKETGGITGGSDGKDLEQKQAGNNKAVSKNEQSRKGRRTIKLKNMNTN